jgi:hypothetical protein
MEENMRNTENTSTPRISFKIPSLWLLLSLGLLLGMTDPVHASKSFTVSLYTGIDLATEMTEQDRTMITLIIGKSGEISVISAPEIDPLFSFSPEIDLYFGVSLEAGRPLEVVGAHIDGMTVFDGLNGFDAITDDMLLAREFTAQSLSITSHDIVVLLVDDTYWMLGQGELSPDFTSVRFEYQQVEGTGPKPGGIPEPASYLLFGAGLLGVLGITRRKRKAIILKGAHIMKHVKIVLFTVLAVSLFVGTALAEEVDVQFLIIGHGYVRGENLSCASNCTKSYEVGSIVQLKAIPSPSSTFVEWKVNGESHDGIITIEKDTVVTAIFKLKTEVPTDDVTVSWYDSFGGKEYATIALDEMVIFFEEREQWGVTTEEEYKAAVQQVIRTFHPEAEITAEGTLNLVLKSPEPLEKEQWFNTLFSLQEMPYVQWAGPVLYYSPGESWSQVMVWNEIYVDFPASYTEDRIRTIEQEYGLVRIEPLSTPNTFAYQAVNPLEAIELANRLYESGQVEHAAPAISESAVPLSEPNDQYFKRQWHLCSPDGQDINVLSAWEKGYTGAGVVIAIVDDGVELTHEDLEPNRFPDKLNDPGNPDDDESYHHDFLEGDHDPIDNPDQDLLPGVSLDIPLPPECSFDACHGTPVAVISSARFNNDGIGVSGVAPFSLFIGYRIGMEHFSVPREIYEGLFAGGKDRVIDIYNNSWGYRRHTFRSRS